MDAIRSARFMDEEARQPLRRKVGSDAGWVDAGARRIDHPAVDIGGKHLHLETHLQRFDTLMKQDGDGVSFLTRGTAGHPDANQ